MKKLIKFSIRLILVVLILSIISVSTFLVIREINCVNLKEQNQISNELGIDKEEIININGTKQYLYIRGQNRNNPLILVLHGGPGSPITPLIYKYQYALENDFTIVNYDQRNAGKTYFLNDYNVVYNSLSFEQMIDDINKVVLYLLEQYNQEKIIILGHSWGSALGTAYVQTYPNKVKAYIGTGQIINSIEGDQLAFDMTLIKAREANNHNDVYTLEHLNGYLFTDDDFSMDSFLKLRGLVNKYLTDGIKEISIFDLLFSPYYTLNDITFFLKSSYEIQYPLIMDLSFKYDTLDYGTNYDVPVFYILGEQDWVTPTVMASEFFTTIQAPKKEMIILENAAHMTMIDNSEGFTNAVLSMLEDIE